MTDESQWPLASELSTTKEREIAKLLFETEGFVPTDRLAAVAGSKEYAVKLVSEVRRKLLPGYQINRSGTGYQLIYPAPNIAPADIKPDDVPYLIAIEVVNDRLQIEYNGIALELGILDEHEAKIKHERERLELKRQTLEYAMLGLAEIMQPLPARDSVTLDRLLSPEVR